MPAYAAFNALQTGFNIGATAALNVVLRGSLLATSNVGSECHMSITPYGPFAQGKISGIDAQLGLATHLNLADPLSIRLEVTSKGSNKDVYKASKKPLRRLVDINKQQVHARCVEYVQLVNLAEALLIPFTPRYDDTAQDVSNLVAEMIEDTEAWEVRLKVNGVQLDGQTLLRTCGLQHKDFVHIKFVGIECETCYVKYEGGEKNLPITSSCLHERATCDECLREWIQSELETGSWVEVQCPQCEVRLEYHDVKTHGSREMLELWDRRATRAALNDIPDFVFCLSPAGCDAGHINECGDTDPLFTCESCSFKQCVACACPWHEGEICAEYRARTVATV